MSLVFSGATSAMHVGSIVSVATKQRTAPVCVRHDAEAMQSLLQQSSICGRTETAANDTILYNNNCSYGMKQPVQINVALRPHKPQGLSETGSPVRAPRLSHSS